MLQVILRAFPTRATRLSSLLCERSEREISKLSDVASDADKKRRKQDSSLV